MALRAPHAPFPTGSTGRGGPDQGPSPAAAIGWLAGGAALTFVVSWLSTTVLGLHHDLYYLVYFTLALGYLGWFVARSRLPIRTLLQEHLWWSVGLGVLVAAAIVAQVMDQPGTTHPSGAYYVFELVWRGVIYGTVDALVLSAFPALVALLVLRGNRKGALHKAAFAGLVLVMSLVVSTSYHLGYSTYRGSELAKPLIGTVMMNLPTVLTGNPAGAVVQHATVHTTAVAHQYYGGDDTNHFLPPELSSSYPDRPGGSATLAIAAAWVSVLAAVVALNRRRIREALHAA
jgi:hypothetical protein